MKTHIKHQEETVELYVINHEKREVENLILTGHKEGEERQKEDTHNVLNVLE